MDLQSREGSWWRWYAILLLFSIAKVAPLQSGWEPHPKLPLSTKVHPFFKAARWNSSKADIYTILEDNWMIVFTIYMHGTNDSDSTWKVRGRSISSPIRPFCYLSAKNMWSRADLCTTKQFPTPPYMQVVEKAEGSLESICIQSKSTPMGPIERQNSTSTSRNFGCINHS